MFLWYPESHLVCSHHQNLFLFKDFLKNTSDNLIPSRIKEQHEHPRAWCQYAFGHFTCNLAYLFLNVDLGGITKLLMEAELPGTSGEKEQFKKENRNSCKSLPINTFFWPRGKSTATMSILWLSWLPIVQTSSTGLAALALIWKYWETSSVWSQMTVL